MARPNVVPIRLSDREMEMVRDTGKRVGATSTSEGVRYAIVHTALALANDLGDPGLKVRETVVVLPDDLVQEIEDIEMPDGINKFQDRLAALLMRWKIS